MDVENLSREELLEIVKAVPTAASEWREVDVNGLAVCVNEKAAKSWKAFDLLSTIPEELTPLAVRKMVDFIELTTDVTEERLLEACGGEYASVDDVVTLASQIITHCYPKNS